MQWTLLVSAAATVFLALALHGEATHGQDHHVLPGPFGDGAVKGFRCSWAQGLSSPAFQGTMYAWGVTDPAASDTFVAAGSISEYSVHNSIPWTDNSAHAFEGPVDGNGARIGIERDYVVGRLNNPIEDAAGVDIRMHAGHPMMMGGACLYGASTKDGPFYLIGGDYPVARDSTPNISSKAFDLADMYTRFSGHTTVEWLAVAIWDGENPLTAAFDMIVGYEGAATRFTDRSYQVVTSTDRWIWDFGDGSTSVARHPSHTYASVGTYTVCLTAIDSMEYVQAYPRGNWPSDWRDTTCQDIEILPKPPTADFTWKVDPAQPYRIIEFNDTSTLGSAPIISWEWTIDGAPYTGQKPIHLFPEFATYPATLTVTDALGLSASVTKPVYLANEPPRIGVLPEYAVWPGGTIKFAPAFFDPENHILHNSYAGGLPGAAWDPVDEVLTWTAPDQPGAVFEAVFATYEVYWPIHNAEGAARVRIIDFGTQLPGLDTVPDTDGDGIDDLADNCPGVKNYWQADTDRDGVGDACHPSIRVKGGLAGTALDTDNDGIFDYADNCPVIPNRDQADTDFDDLGDVCDTDLDGDGVANQVDNCVRVPNPAQNDGDGNGTGDLCDALRRPPYEEPAVERQAPAHFAEETKASSFPAGLFLGSFVTGAVVWLAWLVLPRKRRDNHR